MTSVVIPKLIKGFFNPKHSKKWSMGSRSRMPDHYRNRMLKLHHSEKQGTSAPVHWEREEARWRQIGPDRIVPVQNRPIPVIYPKEADEGLWGGEGMVKGYVQRRFRAPRAPKVWTPRLRKAVLYSEILDLHMSITCTVRARLLIDEAHGLDTYILKTPEEDLRSNLALKLKHKMLVALMDKTLYPDNPDKRTKIYNRYKHYLESYSRDELEWLGLTEEEALLKQEEIDVRMSRPTPLKYSLTADLLQRVGVSPQEPSQNAAEESRV